MSVQTKSQNVTHQKETGNHLFPVFLKLENLRLLIVGGGNVGLEKLSAVLNNSPATRVKLVAVAISEGVRELAASYENVELLQKPFEPSDLEGIDVAILAIDNPEESARIRDEVHSRGKLVNVADKPELCDFYLSSVVRKGDLKIAISTNGKSPTVAKRVKETLQAVIPEEIDELLQNMQTIRNSLSGDFNDKVRQLNEITRDLAVQPAKLKGKPKGEEKKWTKIVVWCLFAFFFMILGHTILSLVPLETIWEGVKTVPQYVDTKGFLIMLATGFIAQMVDGSLGMGYGTISTTFLLAYGVNPAIVSSRVHSARVFSSGASGYSHHRFGNINKKLFRTLVIPGIIGAVLGASMAFFAKEYSSYVRLPISLYTLYLGYYIVRKAFAKRNYANKVKRAGWLATGGGFLDAFAGGGWGTLVTSTLISKRRSPRYVVGSVCLAEFFVVLSSSITFFILLKSIPFGDVAGLIIGGLIAGPISARLAGKLPMKAMFIAIGSLVILTSCNTFWKALMTLMHGGAGGH